MTTTLHAIAIKAQTHPKHRFQNLYGLLDSGSLYRSWGELNKQSAPGVDGVTTEHYQERLPENITRLSQSLKRKSYRASDIKRTFIPKANGKQRPLGLPVVDDKLVQQSVARILDSIWEHDFLPNSYGYRPSKSAHQAIESLNLNLRFKGYSYIVEADIKGFFDTMSHDWLTRMLEQRIDDKALMTLIRQWLKGRVRMPDGRIDKSASGTPQGGVISPILANIYLHYVLDLWFEKEFKRTCKGRAMLIRYADDFVVAFQYIDEARAFYTALPERLAKFDLTLSEEKSHLIQFSRFRPSRQRSFQFLGFEFYWGRDRNGNTRLRRRMATKKLKATMNSLYQWIKYNRSKRLREVMPQLRRKLIGIQNYFGLPDNSQPLNRLYFHTLHSVFKWLNRRSQRRSFNWKGFIDMIRYFRIKPLHVSRRNVVVDWY